MTWQDFPGIAGAIFSAWIPASLLSLIPHKRNLLTRLGQFLLVVGTLLVAIFIGGLWVSLERPPLRTLGETRLWYALFLPLCALAAELRWRIPWLRAYCLAMASLFLTLALVYPESHNKTLPPALQSGWFVPHVIVYIVGYACLGASALVGIKGLLGRKKHEPHQTLTAGNTLVVIGFFFVNTGLIFGAFWAKEAWGHYWTWDPKETWAFLTWLFYLGYLHLQFQGKLSHRTSFLCLVVGFGVLLMCWFGLNYLMTAQQSVHTYGTG